MGMPVTAQLIHALEERARDVDLEDRIDQALELVRAEMMRAINKHRPYASFHEAYGVIAEEVEEFFDEVKANQPGKAISEVVQVAATAARAVVDLKLL